ncbi:DUF1659 domain-containing protein [Planococcus shenhongbingii]|uniref:DUF1659 domain-containing protein n=1 Tax=Planococcus shenhongbingii TaxID=3058398 RepID=A0ABT8ND43_9BACL|nr:MULTISPECIES: DUF1659 domain-containing protein [unclassified Planococcus (in: firmicutes)]MDN7245693.1 DUF1659 domain-containing protein [Planococcus sp. N017]WKA60189.1 DUF1659 domain-containing protein [Planococcus sp. N016]
MAASEFKNANIRCTFDNGLDDKGKTKKKVKAYHNVRETAAADGIYAVAIVLSDFGTKELLFLEKQSGLNIYA